MTSLRRVHSCAKSVVSYRGIPETHSHLKDQLPAMHEPGKFSCFGSCGVWWGWVVERGHQFTKRGKEGKGLEERKGKDVYSDIISTIANFSVTPLNS